MIGLYENEVSNYCAQGDHELCKPEGDDHTKREFYCCQCTCHGAKEPS